MFQIVFHFESLHIKTLILPSSKMKPPNTSHLFSLLSNLLITSRFTFMYHQYQERLHDQNPEEMVFNSVQLHLCVWSACDWLFSFFPVYNLPLGILLSWASAQALALFTSYITEFRKKRPRPPRLGCIEYRRIRIRVSALSSAQRSVTLHGRTI